VWLKMHRPQLPILAEQWWKIPSQLALLLEPT
jgi:hypothetical protein